MPSDGMPGGEAAPSERIIGLILAGGEARRMGGADKALLPLAGKPLLAHVIARLGPQCTGLLLSANGDPARFAAFGLPVVADAARDAASDQTSALAGPLAGILAGLDAVAQRHPACTGMVSISVDTPFLPGDLVARLDAARRQRIGQDRLEGSDASHDTPVVMASSGGRVHPVVALWPLGVRHALRRALVGEQVRAVRHFASRHDPIEVAWEALPSDPFFNINTPDDLAQAERQCSIDGSAP